ncbi:hypothetical protein CGC20_12910 [Leishmania donovani]|uniref:Uncharacterized protein n=1 Tax=Leishmania donovani TaxID=5661 RepID=A0A504Y2M4_LEIDO|nr:hypothetical protein CGC20_12910 [Leishmania donovani]TPP54375.1 hypothetical protein CGC21_22670 [Leishmania donovani]
MLPIPWHLITLIFVTVLLLVDRAQTQSKRTAEQAELSALHYGHMLVDEMPKVDGSDYGALPRVALIVLSNNSRIHGGLADSLTAPKRLRSLEVSRKSVHWNLPSR